MLVLSTELYNFETSNRYVIDHFQKLFDLIVKDAVTLILKVICLHFRKLLSR